MKFVVLALPFTFALALNSGTVNAADQGSAAVAHLGELNGTALACQQMALVARSRNAIVTTAPKTREIGEVFEAATNTAYLKFGSDQKTCPDSASLAQQISAAEQSLAAAFAKP